MYVFPVYELWDNGMLLQICCILCITALVSLVMTANTENLEVDDGSRDKNLDTKTFHEIKVAFAFL